MGILIGLVVLAVLFGAIGLFVAAAKWALILAVLLVAAGVVGAAAFRSRARI